MAGNEYTRIHCGMKKSEQSAATVSAATNTATTEAPLLLRAHHTG